MEKSEKQLKEDEALETLQVYNEEQQFWHNVVENATATITQLENGIKLNKKIKEWAEQEVAAVAD